MPEEHRIAFRRLEFLTKTMEPPLLDGIDTVVCWLSRKLMPLRHHPFKMCEYQAETSGSNDGPLDEKTLLYRLKELLQPKMVRTSEHVPMFNHDNPPPEVRLIFYILSDKPYDVVGFVCTFSFSAPQVGGGGLGASLV